MSDRIVAATRKGLFFFERANGGWTLAGDAFLGSPMTYVLADPRDGMLYAAANLGHFGPKLHRSADGGKSWDEIAMPAFPKADAGEDGDEAKGPSVVQVWSMALGAGGAGNLWAGTIPGGLFRSTDGGASWALNEPLWTMPERERWMGGGYDQPGIHSLCVDPRNDRHVSLAVSTGGVWRSEDDGKSWRVASKGLRAAFLPPDMQYDEIMQDPHLMVQCASAPDSYWIQHHNGIFRSTDNLGSWQEIEPQNCPAFGFAVAVHPTDPETAWFVPAVKDEYRYPRDGKFVVSRTRDGGVSFEVIDKGLPQVPSYDLVYRHGLDVDSTGSSLVMGSTTGGAWVSGDGGDSWEELPARLPPVYAVRFV
ncbi:MAG: hypothetical protein KDE21_05490 [Novosphingobium sp.]|nr:hypothetical protein [Novosphingobium sp.]